jgi:sortase (surface protein transpeptidase)
LRKVLLIVGGLLVVLVAAGGYYTIHQRSVGSKQTPAHSTTAATHTPSAQGTQFASAPPGATPIPSGFQLVISKIHVNATIEKVGLDKNGAMAVPVKPMDVGLYTAGPQPGAAQGDVVIDGHLDWYNLPRAVFYDLNKLQPGDQIDVVSNGKVLHYKVTDSATYPYTSHPVGLFSASGPPRLSLITCAGSWDAGKSVYSQRLVVNANYVGSN